MYPITIEYSVLGVKLIRNCYGFNGTLYLKEPQQFIPQKKSYNVMSTTLKLVVPIQSILYYKFPKS